MLHCYQKLNILSRCQPKTEIIVTIIVTVFLNLNHKNIMKTHFLKFLDLFEFWVEVVGDIDII